MVVDGEIGNGLVVMAFRCWRASHRTLSRLISPKSLFDISKASFELQRRFTPPGFAPTPSSLRSWILHLAFLEKVFVKVIHVLNPLQLLLLAAGEEMENQPSIKVSWPILFMAHINKPPWMPCTLFERPIREDVTFRLREISHKRHTTELHQTHTWRLGCSWARNRQTVCQVMQTAFLRVSRSRSRKARAASNKCYYLGSCGASFSKLGVLLTVSSAALSSWEYKQNEQKWSVCSIQVCFDAVIKAFPLKKNK